MNLDWVDLGLKGALLRRPSPATVEEILCGFIGTRDPGYAMRVVVTQYQHARDALPIKAGDRVRVRRRYWCLGAQDNGWHGYAAMFADVTATVKQVVWNPYRDDWAVDATYPDPYRWSDYRQDFDVKDHPSTFSFRLEHLKVIKPKPTKDKAKEAPCGE